MKLHRQLILTCTLLALQLATTAHAQLVADGATLIINGTSTNLASDLTVGSAGPNTTLIITNGGSVTANNAVTGSSAASTNNLIAVSGAGSKLTTPGGGSVLRTGNVGAFNRLLISGGGAASAGFGVIGYPVGASNNTVLVTDSGSVWSNSVLYVGEGGSGNSLTIANAGRVVASGSTIGVLAGATNNVTVVTGSNSLWTTANTINVGDAGGGSQLRVGNAGTVTGTGLVLGNQTTSGNNFLAVAGTNSVLTVTNAGGDAAFDVRRGSVEFNGGVIAADHLLITNGTGAFTFNDGKLITRTATIKNGQNFVVGANAGTGAAGTNFANIVSNSIASSGTIGPAAIYPSVINVANVGGPITKVTVTLSNLSHTFPQDLDVMLVSPTRQKVMLMSDVGGGNPGVNSVTLTFDDAAASSVPANSLPAGTYRSTDEAPGDPFPYPMPVGPYSTNLSDFNGSSPNGAWSLFIVDDFNGDSGGLGAWSLKITTANPAATWDVRSNATPTVLANALYIGSSAANATLMVTNGATLSVGNISFLGNNSSANNNRAIIAGPNSLWTNSSDLYVGASGSGNTLLITNSGRVANNYGYIGYGSAFPGESSFGNNNQATVTGTNSLWNHSGDLSVGHYGSGNALLIASGGTVMNSAASIGYQSIANNNQVTVSGANSMWSNSASLNVGFDGSFSTLLVTSGGTVRSANTIVGVNFDSSGNLITVSDGTFNVTNATKNAALDVRRGSVLFNGGNITADQLLLTNGASSVFTFNGGTLVTRTANINNGQNFIVGESAGFSPATWDIRSNAAPTSVNGNLYVGQGASNARLLITNGAAVANAAGTLGVNSGATNNAALVTGVGSVWNNSSELRVGDAGSVNTLLISNGGAVSNTAGRIGFAGNNNAVIVSDSGSLWINSAPLFIGFTGSGNQLMVSNGATVFNTIGYLGNNAGANNNHVTVTDPGSQWINHNNLFIGDQGSFNSLLISNGAEVVVGFSTATIGNASGANTNQVIVTGANSLFRCASQSLNFGNGSFNTLLITNGGTVQARGVKLNSGVGGGNLLTVGNGTLNINSMSLDIDGGSLVFNGGVISASQLMLNGGTFTFNSGTFNIVHALGTPPIVGDGINTATYFMSGSSSDTHLTGGLLITNHATLSGNGYIQNGIVTIAPGGTLSPGSGIGSIALQLPPILQGTITMEISKSGGTLANDFIEIGDFLSLGGSLVVSNLGPDALAAGDNFQLFSTVGPIDGALSSLTLPALSAGLVWKNNLLMDGSIAVVNKTAPNISDLVKSGTNLIFSVTGGSPGDPWNLLTSTNVLLPMSSWITNQSGVFNWLGNATVTNGINFTEPLRFFRMSVP